VFSKIYKKILSFSLIVVSIAARKMLVYISDRFKEKNQIKML